MGGTAKVTVYDYGLGNLYSVCRALEYCGASVELADRSIPVGCIERLVVPGVGAFADCVAGLRQHGQFDSILEFAATGRPFLGICVGMQMLLDVGEEFGEHTGLGLISGRVQAIPSTATDGAPLRLPRIGWSPLRRPEGVDWTDTIFEDVEPGEAVYFVHSFAASPGRTEDALATYAYGGYPVVAAVRHGNITGVQFHPERSGPVGLRILRKFLSSNGASV
jgi:imidazole glycerol-phosphate synthase subunit HisH